jgi:hypothetical protein
MVLLPILILSAITFSQTTVNTISDLRELSTNDDQQVIVAGYYAPGDGGGGIFYWDGKSTEKDNYGTIIQPNNGAVGRWKRDYSGYDHINVLWFGASGDDNPNDYNHIRIQASIDYAANTLKIVYLPVGIYQIKNSIRFTEVHNNLVFKGELRYKFSKIPRDSVHNIIWSPIEDFRVVDELNSSIIKASDFGFKNYAYVVRVDYTGGEKLNGLHLKDFAINGNKENNTEGGTALFLYARENSLDLRIENFAAYNSPAAGIMSYQSNVFIRNYLAYLCNYQGLGTRAEASGQYENIEVHNIGFGGPPYGYSGINFQKDGTKHTLINAQVHHCWSGQKITAPDVTIFNSVYEYNFEKGINIFAAADGGIFNFDKIIVRNNGNAGAHLNYGKITIGKIESYNNGVNNTYGAWGGLILTGTIADSVIVKDQSTSSYGNYALRIGNVEINYVEVCDNGKLGIDVLSNSTAILFSGKIMNNKDYGIQLRDNSTVHAYNIIVGDTQQTPTQIKHEFWDPWNTATIFKSGLDFTYSKISPENRLLVKNIYEISNLTLLAPKNGEVYNSGDIIKIEAVASAPDLTVQYISFYSNEILIHRSFTYPYSFNWQNVEVGEHSIKAVATFNDNSTLTSKEVMIEVVSGNKYGSHKILIDQGWNLISTYILPNNTSIGLLLSDIWDNLTLLTNANGSVFWPVFNIDDISTWCADEGYYIFMKAADTLTVTGHRVSPSENPIQLQKGWNIGAYLSHEPLPVQTAVQNIQDQLSLITNNDGDIYWPDQGIYSLQLLEPGKGYRFYMKESASLIYPDVSVTAQSSINTVLQSTHFQADETSNHYQLNFNNTGSSSILLLPNVSFDDGDEIGVWGENNSLVGSAPVQNGKAAITIWGKNQLLPDLPGGAGPDEKLYLTRWSAAEGKEYRLSITSLSKLDGTRLNDHVLRFEQNSIMLAAIETFPEIPQYFILNQNYPNPFNPTTTIEYAVPYSDHVKLEIYNTIGQKVVTLVDAEHSPGNYRVIFDAAQLSTGIYFYRLSGTGFFEVKRMVYIK